MPLAVPTAALLSLGRDAVLSHRSAAAIWGLADPDPNPIEITVVARHPRSRQGVRLHRVRRLDAADTTARSNLRLTSLARTAIDFASQATSSELHDAFAEARAKHRLTDRALHAALDRLPANDPGASIVRSMLTSGETYDRSKAERIMRTLCRQAQLPQPVVNYKLHGFLVDFLWRDAKLIVEVDGHGTHGTRRAFENDRRRDQVHAAAGYLVIRITWEQLQNEPLAVLARLAQALAHRTA
jgi:very-short-patch-repair endonuclease